jgi:hypothetical protein
MQRLGMHRLHNMDFEHPDVPVGNKARRHITYAIERPASN